MNEPVKLVIRSYVSGRWMGYMQGSKQIGPFLEVDKEGRATRRGFCGIKSWGIYGESRTYHKNGRMAENFFHIEEAQRFGEQLSLKETGEINYRIFYHHNKMLHGFPFLPTKPERLPKKSNRNRFNTLEIVNA